MILQDLHENWTMGPLGAPDLPAVVPGSVYGDLLAAGRMEDPFYRDNELAAGRLMDQDYEYLCTFNLDDGFTGCSEIVLRCEGLDTLAELYLNEVRVGTADNMHRTWEFPITGTVQERGNVLRVVFRSPTRFIRQADQRSHAGGSSDAMAGFPHLRKAHSMFGWDWGPRLPDAGIWRSLTILGIEDARIADVHVRQRHSDTSVTLAVAVAVDSFSGAPTEYSVTVEAPDGTTRTVDGSPAELVIEAPELWWPNGYGTQPLYRVQVDLRADGRLVDTWSRRIGLRTMTVLTDADEYGSEFTQTVNGVRIFAMGADYIPEDNLLGRVTPERTRHLLEQCVRANFNAVRVWGGGYYPDDFFFDACDELGLVVWQDFMFSCAVYNLDEEFEANIAAEIEDNVKRLRHHASLGLWCGNNEMEMFVDQWAYDCTPAQKADYIKMYEYLFPKLVRAFDPDTFYWPASPSSGGGFDEPNAPDRGDVHYWDVWHGSRPFSDYRKFHFRYASEFGFQSFPSVKTIETFTLPEDRNIFSYVMDKHQRNNGANGKIMSYLSQIYLYPNSFDRLVYASQLVQAQAIQYGVEHWRRHRGRCMGAIYWQLNDCWPVASWSSVDYFGRWKALHYYARRFYAPLLLSCCEEGLLTQGANVNAESTELEKSIRLNVANETFSERHVRVKWALRNADASVVVQGEESLTVPALESVWLEKRSFTEADIFSQYVSYELYEGGERLSGGSVLFGLPRFFRFLDPGLEARVEGDTVVVTANAYARAVCISNEADDLVLSDNFFDMDAGERRVTILEGSPAGITLRSVYDIR
jgi:beta-mannosidase